MEGHLFINFILISLLLPTKGCLLSGGEGCGMSGLSYGGRMAVRDEGGSGYGSPPPWSGKRVFIFQVPLSFHKTRSFRSTFGRFGVGRIWTQEEHETCGRTEQQVVCPFTTGESLCLDSSRPCYQTPPSYTEPEPLSFSDVTRTSITVTWQEWDESIDQGSGPIVEYIIEIRRAGQAAFSKVPKGRQLSHRFLDLAENTYYEFRVVIIRDHPAGEGPPSNVQITTTRGLPAYTDPNPLQFSDVTSSSVIVSWPEWDHTVDEGTGPVTGYKLIYSVGSGETYNRTGTGVSVQLSELEEGTTYEMMLKLRDEDGNYGRVSDAQSVTIPCGDLGNIDLVLSTSSNRVDANWSFRNLTGSCGVVSQTILFHQLDIGNCKNLTDNPVVEFPFDRDIRSHTVDTHHAYSLYQVNLIVRTHMANYTKSKTIRTNPTVPTGKPLNVRSTSRNRQHTVKMRWRLPRCKQRHGIISHYEYIFGRENNELTGNIQSPEVSFSELIRDELFSFKVRAVSSTGPGPYSDLHTDRF